jgi:dienelactone hydrolase
MGYEAALKDYQKFEFTDGPWTRPVYRRGLGPAVIIIHEIPGLHPLVLRFADHVAAAGKPVSPNYAMRSMLAAICIRREFHVWSTQSSSPIVDWLRALARQAHAECGGKGVGAVGMCFTGGFALAMMTEPAVVAPVLSQPSMPIAAGSKKRAAGIDASPREIACAKQRLKDEDLTMLALRYKSDVLVPDARFETLSREFGDRVEIIELGDEDAAPAHIPPHSVLTLHLMPTGPSKAAEDRVIQFFKDRTGT